MHLWLDLSQNYRKQNLQYHFKDIKWKSNKQCRMKMFQLCVAQPVMNDLSDSIDFDALN